MNSEASKKAIKKRPKARKAAPKAKPRAIRARSAVSKRVLKIPSILLEGDEPPLPALSGPGQRYVLSPTLPETAQTGVETKLAPAAKSPLVSSPPTTAPATGKTKMAPPGQPPVKPAAPGPSRVPGKAAAPISVPALPSAGTQLPEAYGTQKLLLTARDPHWLYASWDLTPAQLNRYNAQAADGHLILRIFRDAIEGKPFSEIHLHPASRNWFAHVGLGGARFLAELGYYQRPGKWITIATSKATLTPSEGLSDDLSVTFATLPADLKLGQLVKLVEAALHTSAPLVEALQAYRAAGHAGLPAPKEIQSRRWTPAQEQALAKLVTMDSVHRAWIGSLEITELVRRQLPPEQRQPAPGHGEMPPGMVSPVAGQEGRLPFWSGPISGISSPAGVEQPAAAFWFNVNAELIIYGATEPNAQVTVGGQPIKLRADGTFSYRFALPDGAYALPVVAASADGSEQRSALLSFRRTTEYQGQVTPHPQDAQLKPPPTKHAP